MTTIDKTCNKCKRQIVGILKACKNCMKHFHNYCFYSDKSEDLKNLENDNNFICRKCIGNCLHFGELIEQDFQNAISDLTTNMTQPDRDTLENLVFVASLFAG